jgi:hypothetical protein
MKKSNLKQCVVIIFDQTYSKPMSVCVGSHLMPLNGPIRPNTRAVRHQASEPEQPQQVSYLPEEKVTELLEDPEIPQEEPQPEIPIQEPPEEAPKDDSDEIIVLSDGPGMPSLRITRSQLQRIKQHPLKFQVWAIKNAFGHWPRHGLAVLDNV